MAARKTASPARKAAPAARKTAPAGRKAAVPAGRKAAKKEPARRNPIEDITIGVTPPHMAEGTEAFAVDRKMGDRATRPGTVALSRLPWLRQDRSYRVGYYMLTHGLRQATGHREIEVCNVPALFVRSTMELLNTIADGILNDGLKLRHGATMLIGDPSDDFAPIVGFRRIRPGEHGSDHEVEVLRLLFLR